MATTPSYFLHLDEAAGEQGQKGFVGQIGVKRWSYGGSSSSSVGMTKGSGSTKAQMYPMEIEAELDKSFPKLAAFLTKGKHINEATLSALKQDGNSGAAAFFVITMQEVFVHHLHVEGHGDSPILTFTLTYKSIKSEYKQQNDTGDLETAGSHQFNAETGETT